MNSFNLISILIGKFVCGKDKFIEEALTEYKKVWLLQPAMDHLIGRKGTSTRQSVRNRYSYKGNEWERVLRTHLSHIPPPLITMAAGEISEKTVSQPCLTLFLHNCTRSWPHPSALPFQSIIVEYFVCRTKLYDQMPPSHRSPSSWFSRTVFKW